MANIIKQVMPGVAPYATDVDQFRQILSGTADVGPLAIAGPTTAPTPPVVAAGSTGVLNGTYNYVLVAVTGWKENNGTINVRGLSCGNESVITVTSKQVLVTIPALVAPVVGYLVYRSVAGGGNWSEKYVTYITNGTTSFTDNVADGSLGVGMPSFLGGVPTVPMVNTTGTSATFGSPVVMSNTLTVNNNVQINGNLTATNFPKASTTVLNSSGVMTVATLTPAVQGNFDVKVYLTLTMTTTFIINVFWTDLVGLQANQILPQTTLPQGSYTFPSLFIHAMSGSPISVIMTSAPTGVSFCSASIVGV